MDVSRRYYEEADDFIRALGRNSHRRRHLPFWNLALQALHLSDSSSPQSTNVLPINLYSSSALASATSGTVQSAVADVGEAGGAFSRAMTKPSGSVVFITFHTSPTSHVAPMSYATQPSSSQPDEVLVASALFTSSLIVLFCADDTLDNLVASWIYAEITAAHRNRGNVTNTSSNAPTTSRVPPSSSSDKLGIKSLSSLPSSTKPLRFSDKVSLYGSMAHVRSLLDIASNAARDPKLQLGSSDPSTPKRYIPSDYRMSRDDSGMRVLGRDIRASVRPQASEFAFGPSVFKRRTRNAYRLFFIATERLEAIDKAYAEAATSALVGSTTTSSTPTDSSKPSIPIHDTSKLILDAAKSLRLANNNDWDELKAILKRENPEPESGEGDEESDFDTILEALQKGNVYLWESSRPNKSGKLGKPKIRCFSVLEFHQRPLPELSCVEIVDLHVSNPRRDTDSARMLTESLSRKFLTATVSAPAPYHFLFVKVDVSVPESSDRFLLDCGFVADSVADFVTLEIVQSTQRRQAVQQEPFEITRVVKVSPLTEKPFSAYEIRVLETNELVKKRYREFDKLYLQLKAQFPNQNIPKLPKKKLFGNMDENFVEKRRLQLQTWLNTISQLPGVEESGWVANFLWTDLKIRGVKAMSEEERLYRTLQRQAEEARVNVIASASASATGPSNTPWPPRQYASSASSSNASSTCEMPAKTSKPTKAKEKREKKSGRRLSQ